VFDVCFQSYMEDHLTNKDRLQKEWDTLCAYDAEPCSVVAAIEPTNMRKNRFTDILPCMRHAFHSFFFYKSKVKI